MRPFLGSTIELWLANLPGREGRLSDPHPRALEPLSTSLEQALLDRIDAPLAVFGHSFGALVGFELALRLAEVGRPPLHVFVSAQASPRRLPLNLDGLVELVENRIEPSQAVEAADGPAAELASMMAQTLRDDCRVLMRYPGREPAPAPFPLTVFGAADDEVIPRDTSSIGRSSLPTPSKCSFSREGTTSSSAAARLACAITSTLGRSMP